jgi:hypothetical protein
LASSRALLDAAIPSIALLGSLIVFRNPLAGAIIATVLFVAWNYYPHNFGLPIIKTIEMDRMPG